MASTVSAPANLRQLVSTAFTKAREKGDLMFFPTKAALVRVGGFPFQLRYAPSLKQKPKGSGPKAPVDPFANPPPGLVVVGDLGRDHSLVLNKFAICPDHAILITKDFQWQNRLLEAGDLAAAYACIEAYDRTKENDDDGLFVFYNSGDHSGASQKHRHLQMLPVSRMREGLGEADAAAWGVLIDSVVGGEEGSSELPFDVAAARLPAAPVTPAALHALYLSLYRQAREAVAAATSPGDSELAADNEEELQGRTRTRISYNLALTRQTMAVCPRMAEGARVQLLTGPMGRTHDASVGEGALMLNGTVLAGTALVKDEAVWESLRQDPSHLAGVLRKIGVSPRRGTSSL